MINNNSCEYDLPAITENVLELSKHSYELEEKREQSLINQSSQMATVFSFISAVILMLFPVIVDIFPNVPIRKLTILGSIILGLLILSLFLALLVQWRFQYQSLPAPKVILEHELSEENIDMFNTPQQRNKAYVETLEKAWQSKRSLNNRRVCFIKISMLMCFAALVLLLLSIFVAEMLYFN
jgi:hypothetical protein